VNAAKKAWATRRANAVPAAIALLEAHGYRVTKPKAPAPKAPAAKANGKPALNAIGKPYSPQFDPRYRVKHKTSSAHLFKPYSDKFRAHLAVTK
jgi:hypothetical protein